MGQNYHLCPTTVSPVHGVEGDFIWDTACGTEVQEPNWRAQNKSRNEGKRKPCGMASLSERECPLRVLMATCSSAGSQSCPRAALRGSQHGWASKHIQMLSSGNREWATGPPQRGFDQGTAPSLAQAAECCPEELSGISLPSAAFGLDISRGKKSPRWQPRQPAMGALSRELPRRWWSPLLLSIHPFQAAILLCPPPPLSLL